ncbi:MAG: hypothetical protein NTY19_16325 [Planctomycetota bacterium]|nr:hypothetical protein [Planctomycetota bacterium]
MLTRRIPKGRKGEAVLADTAELLDVLREVCEVDPIKDQSFDSERDKLQWVAAAEHARAKATSNPVGFFTTVVTKGLWGYITNAAEESARRRLQKLDRQLRGYENP